MWEEQPYKVIKQPNPDIPVFIVDNGEKTRTLHRNLLLPVKNFELADEQPEKSKPTPRKRMKTRSQKKYEDEDTSDSSDEEYQTDILQKIHVVSNNKETTSEQKEPEKTDNVIKELPVVQMKKLMKKLMEKLMMKWTQKRKL